MEYGPTEPANGPTGGPGNRGNNSATCDAVVVGIDDHGIEGVSENDRKRRIAGGRLGARDPAVCVPVAVPDPPGGLGDRSRNRLGNNPGPHEVGLSGGLEVLPGADVEDVLNRVPLGPVEGQGPALLDREVVPQVPAAVPLREPTCRVPVGARGVVRRNPQEVVPVVGEEEVVLRLLETGPDGLAERDELGDQGCRCGTG